MDSPLSKAQRDALRVLSRRLEGKRIRWALAGSAGLALKGIPVPVHDLDILTDERGAFAIEKEFQDQVTKRVAWSDSPTFSSYYGRLDIGGVQVEIMGDLTIHGKTGDWSSTVPARRTLIRIGANPIPLLSLRQEHEAYVRAGREQKAALIREAVRRSRRK